MTTEVNKTRKTRNRKYLLILLIAAVLITAVVFSYKNRAMDSDETFDGNKASNTKGDVNYQENNPVLQTLASYAETNKDIKYIYDNWESYPEKMLESLSRNTEMAEFVRNYPSAVQREKGGFTQKEKNDDFPLLLQWDERWGYVPYCGSVVGMTGCGPTCLSMAVLALTGNTEATPGKIAEFAEKNGYCEAGSGTLWSFMAEGGRKYGLNCEEVPLWEQTIKAKLDSGCVLILSMGPGDFTTSGHFILIYGYDNDGFLVNDPNSSEKSLKKWAYSDIEDQISNIWAFSV